MKSNKEIEKDRVIGKRKERKRTKKWVSEADRRPAEYILRVYEGLEVFCLTEE